MLLITVVGEDQGWRTVVRRSRRVARWDIMGRGGQPRGRKLDNSTSFFITSFSDNLNAKDMFDEFKGFGERDEVVIHSKRDIRGRKYGFVCFFNVKDTRHLEATPYNIFIIDNKIFVNLIRFKSPESITYRSSQQPNARAQEAPRRRHKEARNVNIARVVSIRKKKKESSRSYDDVLKFSFHFGNYPKDRSDRNMKEKHSLPHLIFNLEDREH